LLLPASFGHADEAPRSAVPSPSSSISVPPGLTIELVAAAPLVEHPMMASFDDQGRLYVADSLGENLPAEELLEKLPNSIRMLEDTDGDGIFDRSTQFADKMTLPMGSLWHDGALYVASPPNIWRLQDTDADGVADRRDILVSKFGFSGNAASIHGCFLGPCGRIYWCDGRHGHEFVGADGKQISKGLAARVFSCRADGSDVEAFCGGGMDNPVEVCFLPTGEMLGTMTFYNPDDVRHDALVHFAWGGVYPRKHPCLSEFKRTGPLMPALSRFDTVAPAGLAYNESAALGEAYRGSVFSVQFNTHKVLRHAIERAGATFRARDEPLLVSTNPDFHPTDVLFDADGSLLVIDTGGWFRIGCPTSRVAKPEVLGAIYRIRRTAASRIPDPRGLRLAWAKASEDELAGRLSDRRPAVRRRATSALAHRGAAAVAAVERVLSSADPAARRNAVWALAQIETSTARDVLCTAVGDPSLDVRLAALRAIGTLRIKQAAARIVPLLKKGDDAAVRRAAATALGRIADRSAVPAVIESLALGGDRFVEHATIYALIEIDDAAQTAAGLKHPSPLVRRGALIALDQMDGGGLSRDQVVSQLAVNDAPLRKAALEIMSRHSGWAKEITQQLRDWLEQPPQDDEQREVVRGALMAFLREEEVQRLLAETLSRDDFDDAARIFLLETLGRSGITVKSDELVASLAPGLSNHNALVRRQTVATIAALGIQAYQSQLSALGSDPQQPADLRVEALAAATAGRQPLAPAAFDFLQSQLDQSVPALRRLAAAETLGQARLNEAQILRLVGVVPKAGPLELPALIEAFADGGSAELGRRLLEALKQSQAVAALNPRRLHELIGKFPADIGHAAGPLWKRIEVNRAEQQSHLAVVKKALHDGDPARGRELFFSQKTACSTCHHLQNEGGRVGPDLSKIGQIRTRRDLLESVVYPSLSLARGYESVTVATTGGQVYTGVIRNETPEAIYLRTAQRAEIRIARRDIDELAPSPQSIMPQGLEKVMSLDELSDLLAFLASQR